jgi:hypothetical protein
MGAQALLSECGNEISARTATEGIYSLAMDRKSYPFVHFNVTPTREIIEQVRRHFEGERFNDFGEGRFSTITDLSATAYKEWLETWLPKGSVTFIAKTTGLMARP